MNFFLKNYRIGPLYQIFLIFQLLSGGVTNLFSCTKLLVVTCRRVINYIVATDSHTWWGNGFFLVKSVKWDFSIFWNFHFFHFSNLSVRFSANFQLFGMELVSNVNLWPILPSSSNNSISTKWALYLRNATYTHIRRTGTLRNLISVCDRYKQISRVISCDICLL